MAATPRKDEDVPDQLLAHLSPLGWEHVNLTGDYVAGNQQGAPEITVGLASRSAFVKAPCEGPARSR